MREYTWNHFITEILHDIKDPRFIRGQAIRPLNPQYIYGIADSVVCTDRMHIQTIRRDNEYRCVLQNGGSIMKQFSFILEVRVTSNSLRLMDPRDIEFIDGPDDVEPIPF